MCERWILLPQSHTMQTLLAISNSMSIVFELIWLILLNICEVYYVDIRKLVWFQRKTTLRRCVTRLYALHEFIYYYRSRSTNVYVTFLYANKAFDITNHWLLLWRHSGLAVECRTHDRENPVSNPLHAMAPLMATRLWRCYALTQTKSVY